MSWGALPWWFYDLEYEQYEAKLLGAFEQEYLSGYTRSTPSHLIQLNKLKESNEKETESSTDRG